MNKAGHLTGNILKENYKDAVHTWYYFSNQSPVIMFANNEWRENHEIKENVVIISEDSLQPSIWLRPFMGIQLDVDLIMVNQVMFTFRR